MIVIYVNTATGDATSTWPETLFGKNGTGAVCGASSYYGHSEIASLIRSIDPMPFTRRFQQPTAPLRPYHFAIKPAPYYRPPQRLRMLRCQRKGIGLRIGRIK